MKRYLVYPVLIFLYLLCSARSCNDNEGKDDRGISSARDSIRGEFESEYDKGPDSEKMEMLAAQKLNDFIEYQRIVSDTSLDLRFRNKASEQLKNLFLSQPETFIRFGQGNSISLDEFVSNCLENRSGISILTADSMHIHSSLQRLNDTLFLTEMRFRQTTGSMKAIAFRNAQLFARWEKKRFGKEEIGSWVVYLGNIY